MRCLFYALFCLIFNINSLKSEIVPNGGENGEYWTVGNKELISWDANNFISTVNIYLWDGERSKYYPIASNLNKDVETFQWIVTEDIKPGMYYRVKVQESSSPEINQMSNSFFPIYASKDSDLPTNPGLLVNTDLLVNPNPCQNSFSVTWEQNGECNLSLMDLHGDIVKASFAYNQNYYVFDCSGIVSGVYYLRIYFPNSGEILWGKVVIKK